ncbi:MAG: ABC transporter ATP-binding protein [Deltaproteobacteria bacterium]|nr:ABC transporter ATP-binding protein [Deltaproteobacteria bacterium]
MLEARGIFFEYNGNKVLAAVRASVEKGGVVSIVGPNGAGKTTLLKCISGILKPTLGTVHLDGRDALGMPRREIAKQLAYMPQSMFFRFPGTVFDTILSGRRPYFAWRPSLKDLEKVETIIEEMELSELSMRDMDQLSSGQVQKVLLARTMIQDTRYLLLDEPNSGLDLRHQMELLETVAALAKGKGIGVMMAMHDLNLAARFSDRIILLHHGKIFSAGVPAEIVTPAKIRDVYGVESIVTRDNGYLNVQVLCCSGEQELDKPGRLPNRLSASGRKN